MRHRSDICHRIAEILEQRNVSEGRAIERATERLSLKREDIMRMLLEERKAASEAGQHGPAVRALELVGRQLGMFVDRLLTKETDDIFETMSDGQLRDLVVERMKVLQQRQPARFTPVVSPAGSEPSSRATGRRALFLRHGR